MFDTQCLFCGQTAKKDKERIQFELMIFKAIFYRFVTKEETTGLLKCVVESNVSMICRYAADALYHQSCSVNFRTKKAKPQTFVPETDRSSKRGRPNNTEEYFQRIVSESYEEF
jgi:hypothetical protein